MTIAEKITAKRNEFRYSQPELAARVDVSEKTVSKWESGRAVPNGEELKRISSVFGLTTDEFLEGTGFTKNHFAGATINNQKTFKEILMHKIPAPSYNEKDISIVWILGIGFAVFLNILAYMLFYQATLQYTFNLPQSTFIIQAISMVLFVAAIIMTRTDLRFLLVYMLFMTVVSLYILIFSSFDFFYTVRTLVRISVPVIFALYLFGVVKDKQIAIWLQLAVILLTLIMFMISLLYTELMNNFLYLYLYNIVANFSALISSVAMAFLLKGTLGLKNDR